MSALTAYHFGILLLTLIGVIVIIGAIGQGLWRLGLLALFALRRHRYHHTDGGGGGEGGN